MGYDVALFAELAGLEERSFWFRARNRLISVALRRWFPEARDFLEVGVGTGFVLAELSRSHPELRLVGVDLSEDGLEFARERVPGAELLQLDALALPFAGD